MRYGSLADNDLGFGYKSLPNISLCLHTLHLYKETEKGYWIGWYAFNNRIKLREQAQWVSKTAKKRYAYPTKQEALTNFIKRTTRRVEILEYKSSECHMALDLANKLNLNQEDKSET